MCRSRSRVRLRPALLHAVIGALVVLVVCLESPCAALDHVQFDSSTYYASLAKDAAPGTHVYRVSATNATAAAGVTYRLLNEQKYFAIDATTGDISTRSRIGRERGPGLQLLVAAADAAGREATATVVVTVSDMAIGFANERELSLSEDCCAPGDVLMVIRINMSYASEFVVRYHLDQQPANDEMRLDAETGLLSVQRAFDYERQPGYKLNVTATIYQRATQHHDHDFVFRPPVKIVSQTVHIDIVNVNDEPPMLLHNNYHRLLPENTPPDTVVMRIEARDPDGDSHKLSYVIPDNHPEHEFFVLNATTGELRTRRSLDRERQAVHRIPVYVFDAGQTHMTPVEAVVVLDDENENAPSFNANNRHQIARIPENVLPGIIFHTMVAADRDLSGDATRGAGGSGGTGLTYRIIDGDPDGVFQIDPQRGDIATTEPLDRERRSSYELTIQANDGVFEATANLTIDVIDVNDNAPIFSQETYTGELWRLHGGGGGGAGERVRVKIGRAAGGIRCRV